MARDETSIAFTVDGATHHAAAGTTVAAAMLNAGLWSFRNAVHGGMRAPLCGMGICYECRVTIDGESHRRACLVPLADGMIVRTSDDARR
jgi:sarcosine oxidase subunit alpha